MDEEDNREELLERNDEYEMEIESGDDANLTLPADLAEAFRLEGNTNSAWSLEYADGLDARRESRGAAGLPLLFDRELDLLGIDASLYPATTQASTRKLLLAIEGAEPLEAYPGLPKDGLYYYLLMGRKPEERRRADAFARSRFVSVAVTVQMRGYWELDHDNVKAASVLLSDPRRFYDEDVSNLIILTLANVGYAQTAPLVTSFIRSTKPLLLTNATRDAYLRALCEQDFPKAWRWVRSFEFEQDLRIQKAREWIAQEDDEVMLVGDGIDLEPEDANEKELEEERKMTLEVVRERKRLLQAILRHVFSPKPLRGPLQQLLWLQIDPFEQSTLISYLTDPASDLSPASFDLLHDLITMRLLNNGQHASAIQLDRRVTELERALGKHIANPKAQTERRQLVDGMIGVLPEVQRRILSLERDLQQRSGGKPLPTVQDFHIENGGSSGSAQEKASSLSNGKSAEGPQSASTPLRQPMSASASFRRATNTSNAIYEALLYSGNTIASPTAGSVGSPMARLRDTLAGASSPRPQATYMQSPFNVPPRMPIGSPRRAASPFERQPTPSSSRHDSCEPRGRRPPSEDMDDREATPVPIRSRPKPQDEKYQRPKMEIQRAKDAPAKLSPSPAEQHIPGAFPGGLGRNAAQQKQAEVPEDQPERARKRIPTARAREAAEQKALRRSTVGRSSKKENGHANHMTDSGQNGDDGEQPEETETSPGKKRKQRKGPTSDEESVPAPKAKKSRKPQAQAPPSPERQRRTRQASVASSVASDATDFSRGLRRSARHSHAPSPTKSEASETAGRRRQTVAGRQGSATPSRGGVRTRRQAAMSPQAEE